MTPLVLTIFDYAKGYAFSLIAYGVFAYLAAIIFGVPAFFIYRALKWTNIFLFVLGGALIGLIFSLPVFDEYAVDGRVWGAVAGALSALMFRIIVYGLNFKGTKRTNIKGET
jgi:hypothetical protein